MKRSAVSFQMLVVVIIGGWIVGCGSGGQNQIADGPTSTSGGPAAIPTLQQTVPPVDERSPRPATLSIQEKTQTAGIGSYCWYGTCVDVAGVATPGTPLHASLPITAQLTLPLEEPPLGGELLVYRLPDQAMLPNAQDDRMWRPPEHPEINRQLIAERQQEIALPLSSGLYLVSVATRWDKRDVLYGFLVLVE